jgi:RND superfamily putative drug exporter
MTLVPAVLALLGDRAWWLPRRLDDALPQLDVEGAGLEHHLEHEAWVEAHGPVAVRTEQLALRYGDHPVFTGVDLTVRPGTLVALCADDRVARRALLATLSGRLPGATGRVVVLGRVLPGEAGAVRRSVPLLDRFPTRPELLALERDATRGRAALVLVDDVDLLAGPDEVEARWAALERLVSLGATVLAGAATAPDGVPALRIDDSHIPTLEVIP